MIKFRVMDIDDYEDVYNIWINTPGMGLNLSDDSREGIGKYLQRNPKTSFVAEDDGKIIGAVMAGHDGRRGYIYHTAVLTDHRNKGIAKGLVERAMLALEEEGINKAALVVFENNEIGNAFWEKTGFTVRGDLVYRNKNIRAFERIDT